MFQKLHKPTVLVLSFIVCSYGSGQHENQVKFFVFPVKTALQRELSPSGADIVVLVDASNEEQYDLRKFDLKPLREVLESHRTLDTKVNFTTFFGRTRAESAELMLRYALIGLAYDLRYSESSCIGILVNDSRTWEDFIESFESVDEINDQDEPRQGNDIAAAFPVNSRFSKYLSEGADCVVYVRSWDEVQDDLDGILATPIKQLQLERKTKILFSVGGILGSSTPPPGGKSLQERVNEKLNDFGKRQGFATVSVRSQ